MARKNASAGTTAYHINPSDLGVLVIGLNSFEPADYRAAYFELRLRFTRSWAERAPVAYATAIAAPSHQGGVEGVAQTELRLAAEKSKEDGAELMAQHLNDAADRGEAAALEYREKHGNADLILKRVYSRSQESA